MTFREKYNKTDAGVRRTKALKFAEEVKIARAQKERE